MVRKQHWSLFCFDQYIDVINGILHCCYDGEYANIERMILFFYQVFSFSVCFMQLKWPRNKNKMDEELAKVITRFASAANIIMPFY